MVTFVIGTWTGAMEWHLAEWYPLLVLCMIHGVDPNKEKGIRKK